MDRRTRLDTPAMRPVSDLSQSTCSPGPTTVSKTGATTPHRRTPTETGRVPISGNWSHEYPNLWSLPCKGIR